MNWFEKRLYDVGRRIGHATEWCKEHPKETAVIADVVVTTVLVVLPEVGVPTAVIRIAKKAKALL